MFLVLFCFLRLPTLLQTIFSSAWLCQQSSWNRNSSVIRPSVCGIDYLWSYCMNWFQISVVASPGPYAQMLFEFWKKNFFDILGIFFVFVNMGPYGSQNFKTLLLPQIAIEYFETSFEFPNNRPHKVLFWIFAILSFWLLTNFLNSPLYPTGKPKSLNYLENERQ